MFEEFRHAIDHRHEIAKEWKERTGKPVMGYLCCVFPEEVLFACGVLPVRIVGDEGTTPHVDGHITPYGCTFCRKCVDLAAQGVYDYLDAVFVSNTCDLVSNLDYWWNELAPREELKIAGVPVRSYVNFFNYPQRITGPNALSYTMNEIRKIQQAAERYTRSFISDEDLKRALEVYDEHNRLMRELHEIRKQSPPPLSGYEAWMVEFAAHFLPKDEHNRLLRNLLEALKDRTDGPQPGIRLYLSASATDQVTSKLIDRIESYGGVIVSEDISVHSSYYWSDYALDRPPLEAIARFSLSVPCPRSTTADPYQDMRYEHIKRTLTDYDVRGLVFYILMQCECRASEVPYLREKIESELKIPVLFLDSDYFDVDSHKTRTRVEAFLEMLR